MNALFLPFLALVCGAQLSGQPSDRETGHHVQTETEKSLVYKDIHWHAEYNTIQPPQQDPALPNSFLLDDLAWVREKMDSAIKFQSYSIYGRHGDLLYIIRIYRHKNTEYLKAYMMRNYMDGGGHPLVAQDRRTHIPTTIYSNNQEGLVLSGYMPGDHEGLPQFQKYPKKKSLLLYIHDGYGIENYTAYDRTTPATPEEELALFKRFIAVCKGEIPVQHDDAEIERRQKLYSQLIENRWHKLEKNTTEYTKKQRRLRPRMPQRHDEPERQRRSPLLLLKNAVNRIQ